MTPAEERDLGLLVGRIDGKVEAQGQQIEAVDRAVAGLRQETAAFHGELRQVLEQKAPRHVVESLEGKVDSLEATRDRGTGRSDLLKGAIGAGLTLLGIAVSKGIL